MTGDVASCLLDCVTLDMPLHPSEALFPYLENRDAPRPASQASLEKQSNHRKMGTYFVKLLVVTEEGFLYGGF